MNAFKLLIKYDFRLQIQTLKSINIDTMCSGVGSRQHEIKGKMGTVFFS